MKKRSVELYNLIPLVIIAIGYLVAFWFPSQREIIIATGWVVAIVLVLSICLVYALLTRKKNDEET